MMSTHKQTLPPRFEKAAHEWLAGREGLFAARALAIARCSIKHLIPVFGQKLLCDITPKAIEAYQWKRIGEGVPYSVVNIEVRLLLQILKANVVGSTP